MIVITSGLYSHMVMQRTGKDQSAQPVSGKTEPNTDVYIRVEKNGKALKGFSKKKFARSGQNGIFNNRIAGIPTGGPCRIILNAGKEKAVFDDVMVGDVWLFAGQSNMEGIGNLDQREKPDKNVRAFYMDERWDIAEDPIHVLADAVAPVHRIISPDVGRSKIKGVGPAVTFGKVMAKEHGVPQGLIPSAHGGTSMNQWKPAKSDKTLFGASIDRVKKNGGKVAGLLWYQGESDAGPESIPVYTKKMKNMIRAFRKELGNIPVAAVQIARVSGTVWSQWIGWTWDNIREQQRLLPEKIKKLQTVPAIDLPTDDLIHIGGDGQKVLGRRLAGAMDSLRYGKKKFPAPIELEKIEKVFLKKYEAPALKVTFKNVVGSLTAPGRPNGFFISVGGTDRQAVYRIRLEGASAYVFHSLEASEVADGALSYGFGIMPYCNITDEGGRSLPAFGPIPLGSGHPKTGFADNMEASPLLPWPGSLDKVKVPALMPEFSHVPLMQWYNPIPELRETNEQKLVWYRYRFISDEQMKLELRLGYDGPLKVFMDGKTVFSDPDGCEPIGIDEKIVPVSAGAGGHEILLALGSNKGRALGVSLRISRTDVKLTDPAEKQILPEPVL